VRFMISYLVLGVLFSAFFFSEWASHCGKTNVQIDTDVVLTTAVLTTIWPTFAVIYFFGRNPDRYPECPKLNISGHAGASDGRQ